MKERPQEIQIPVAFLFVSLPLRASSQGNESTQLELIGLINI